MYIEHSPAEHQKGLRLADGYTLDGFLCYGTYNPAILDTRLTAALETYPDIRVAHLEHPFLSNVRELTIGKKVVWAAIAYGGAQLSELTHLASMFGSKTNVLVGSCGGLKHGISSGDIIVPKSSYSDDTSAKLYSPDNATHLPSEALSSKFAETLASKSVPVWRETMVTCQAMLGETWENVEQWSEQGFGGVEMEAATIFAVSSHFKVPSAALLYVGDNLIEKQTNLTADFEKQAAMRAERQKLLFDMALAEVIASPDIL